MKPALVMLACLGWSANASAHVLDRCVQAATLALEPDRVRIELRLTPGLAIAAHFLATIDSDGDGAIDATEAHAYTRRLAHDVTLAIDGRQAPLEIVGAQFPPVAELRGGGVVRVQMQARVALAGGAHRLQLRNDHASDLSLYLVNVLHPGSDAIVVGAQRRDRAQRQLEVDFDVRRQAMPWPWLIAAVVVLAMRASVRVGVRTRERGMTRA